ncbi:unnamed protein product [Clonostachys byssicola]|uniref:Alpha/beta hydrolase fold-3 domain-containing protein n=1 Tax=Clonostachys byssicola TaxID=160290 RepID=A0A9N9UTP9_9HYPO|nr:unnamed protein product [Clonostachys byssicola]
MSLLRYDPEFYEEAAAAMNAQLPVFPVGDVESRRTRIEEFIRGAGGLPPIPENVTKQVHHAQAKDGHQVQILHFRRTNVASAPGPAIVHIHGGGYTCSNAGDYSPALGSYVSETGVPMLSIDYRLAPEHRFPVPLEDCWSALLWIQAHAAKLNIDPNRLAIMGESAGGGLAAAIAILARDRKMDPPLAKQILIYPMLDDRTVTDHTGGLAVFGIEDVLTGWAAYLGDIYNTDKVTPYAAPGRLQDVTGLPPLYLDCGGLDMFARENVSYANRFIEANIPLDLHIYEGVPHAFQRFAPRCQVVKRAIANRLAACKTVPFSEPPWLTGLPSPYYKDSHKKWQKACREFISEHLTPYALEWETQGNVPEYVFELFSKHNMLIPNLPAPLPIDMLKSLGITELLGGLRIEDFDYMHFSIYISEMRKVGIGGPTSSLSTGMAYGMPPIITYGSQELQRRLLPDLIMGKKRICIAITEPDAGSDVANITTTATKTTITNGVWCHYATMAVRTGCPGAAGISLLVVPLLDQPGVDLRRMKTSGGTASGTTFIDLEDMKVPVENLIGSEGQGMKMITRNFNHERLAIVIGIVSSARAALSAAFSYVSKREAFGSTLMEQPVVRNRLARAGAELESLSAWADQLVYQIANLEGQEARQQLGGFVALAKAKAGLVLDECARCAVLLFGGNGYTRTGQGELVEKIYREIPGARIPGGSEDVMFDLAVRQLLKTYRAKSEALKTDRAKI